MITTLFFVQLIAFQIWYVTSDQVKYTHPPKYLAGLLRHKRTYRQIGVALMLLVTIAFIVLWGWMTGICASIVGLMGAGSLVVLFNPFRYISEKAVVTLYALFVVLEFLI